MRHASLSPRTVRSVVVVNDHACINGGQAAVAIDSALALRDRGLDVCFVAGLGPADPRLAEAGVEIAVAGGHDLLSDPSRLRAAARGLWNPRAASILAHRIAARDPATTVVHLHGWSKALSPSVGPVLARSAAAHVATLHDYSLACPNGGFYDHRQGRICTRPAMGARCLAADCDSRHAAHKAWRVARQAVLQGAGRLPGSLREVIHLTPRQRAILAPYLPPEARWHHLPNPAGPRPTARVPVEANDLVLFAGRLSPEKGAEVAAAAARRAGVPIAFAGDGERRDAVLRANPDARMLGWLDSADLEAWMRRARCLAFPSLWHETYGLVVADALRMGLPSLVSDASVATSLVAHGVDGLHVRTGDVAAWAEAMGRLRDDPTARAMGVAAYRAGARLPDLAAHADGLLDIYDQALARRRARSLAAARPAEEIPA